MCLACNLEKRGRAPTADRAAVGLRVPTGEKPVDGQGYAKPSGQAGLHASL